MLNDKDRFRASSGRTDLGVLGLKKAKVENMELLEKLHEPTTERTLRRDLVKLKEQGILSTRGQGRAVVWFCIPATQ